MLGSRRKRTNLHEKYDYPKKDTGGKVGELVGHGRAKERRDASPFGPDR